SILNLPKTLAQAAQLRGWDLATLRRELAEDRARLLEVRDQRVRPGKDDKILVSWNALMIDALARASGVLDEPRYALAAERAAQFLLDNLRRSDGRLLHSWRSGEARIDAYLDDYAYLINALVSLYEADFNEKWIDVAVELASMVLQHFLDPIEGGFYYTADDHEQLITRQKEFQDSSVPSSNGMAATALLRLGILTGNNEFIEAARGTLELATGLMEKAPTAAGQLLLAADMVIGPVDELVVLAGDDERELDDVLSAISQRFLPNRVVACRNKKSPAPASPALDGIF